jgi:hypothetical protein
MKYLILILFLAACSNGNRDPEGREKKVCKPLVTTDIAILQCSRWHVGGACSQKEFDQSSKIELQNHTRVRISGYLGGQPVYDTYTPPSPGALCGQAAVDDCVRFLLDNVAC